MDPLNREFLALLEASGWSKAEAARQLDVTPSLISQYASGGTRPSPQMVRLFKLVLATERPEALEAGPNAPELRAVQTQVREIHGRDAGAFRSVRAMVDGVHRSLPPAPVKPARGERRNDPAFLKKLAKAHPLRSEVSERKPKAASTSGSKSAPRPPVSKHPSTPPPVPAPVPAGHES